MVRKPNKKKHYCCELMEYSQGIGRIKKSEYDYKWYVWCSDCGTHDGDPINFCPFCGKSLQAPNDNLPQNTNTVTYDGRIIHGLE